MTAKEFRNQFLDDSPVVEVQTSGSTGKPKKMLVEKTRMLASARMTCDFLGLKRGDNALLCMNPDYIAGKMMVVRAIERGLNLVVQEPSGHPLASSQTADIDFLAIVPLQLYNTLSVPEERERLKGIANVIIGGGTIDEQTESQLRDFPNAIWSTYGMTETLSHVAMRRISGPEASRYYSPMPGVSLSQDSEGCIVIDAPALCAETLHTNDIVEMLPDRRFRILGRRDNVICSGGVKLQIEEIERQLRPYVHDAFVVSKAKDAKFGEVVVLLCKADVDDVREVCRGIVWNNRYECPRRYIHVESIPLTETGKPARAEIEKMVAELVDFV